MIRKDYNDQIFRTEQEKNNAIIEKINECYEKTTFIGFHVECE